MENDLKTPWQRVLAKFGMSQNGLAKELGWHGSMISRRIARNAGLINAADQIALLELAKRTKVDLKPEDLIPVIEK